MTKEKHQQAKITSSEHSELGLYDCFFKLGFRANGSALLPLALRPGLKFIRGLKSQERSILRSLSLLSIMLALAFIFQTSYVNNVSAASITLTIPSDPLSLDISDSSANNGFHKSSASTFSVKTDASAGYTLSIKAKNNDSDISKSNDLINGSNNSSKISSILSPVSEEDFTCSGATNTWGYLPSKLNSIDNTDFQPGPTSVPSTIDKTSSANPDEATTYNFTLATKVDNSILAGNYNNTFILTTVANTTPYSITYNLNSGENGPEPNPQTGSTTEKTIELSSTTPTKENSEFKGWCDAEPANNDSSDPTCSGTTYQPGDSYSLTPNDPNSITLYAIWKKVNSCPQPVTDCSYNGTEGKKFGNSPCYMSSDAIELTTWSNASSYCPSGWFLPSKTDFDNLLSDSQAGSGACLYEQGWKLNGYRYSGSVTYHGSYGFYWSSTPDYSSSAYGLSLNSSSARVDSIGATTLTETSVRCLVTEKQYNITYNLNSGSWSGTSPQTGSTYDNSITLDSHTPTKSGYTFRGWCSSSSISNNNTTSTPSCNGTTYQPNGTYSLNVGTNNLNLYAMWQTAAPEGCSGLIPASPSATFGGKRWTTTSVTCTWSGASQVCPSGYHLPSQSEFQSLINYYGSGSGLYNAGWPIGYYWSSTLYSSGYHYYLFVNSISARIIGSLNYDDNYSRGARCVSS